MTSLSDITASIFLPTSMSAIKLMVKISALPEESFRPATPFCFGISSLSQIPRSTIGLLLLFLPLLLPAQQPFLTDDADVAPVRHFHLELLSDHSWLHSSSYPAIRQNTNRFQLTYGPRSNLEIGVDGPLLAIFNAPDSGTPNAFGFGDVNLQTKYRMRTEREGSRWPSVTMALYIELPTGTPRNQLGSGIADFWVNGIAQKKLSPRVTYRLNTGLLFSGNTLTGAIGIRNTRGKVFTGSSSVTLQATDRWLIGAEVAGATTQQFDLGKALLQGQFGAKYAVTKTVGLDLAVTGGKFEGSPRLGMLIGISVDF